MSDLEALKVVQAAFGICPRPEHFFAGYRDDPEWADHDELLRSHTANTIRLSEVGNVGFNPISEVDTAGYLYYMPGLARVLLGAGGEEYLFLFLCQLRPERIAALTPDQREVVARLLIHVRDTRGDAIEFDRDDLAERLQQLGSGE